MLPLNPLDRADVLIVTAVPDEWAAVIAIDTGAVLGSTWEQGESTGPVVKYRDFATDGAPLRIAVVQAFAMGGEQAVIAAAPVLERYPGIRCLAMCGVCAGRRGDVALGDVIVADRTWPYDAGKLKASVDEDGQRTQSFQGDMELYRIHPPEWKQAAERFQPDPTSHWIKTRPPTFEAQGDWLLAALATNDDPVKRIDRMTMCPDWSKVVKQLWKTGRLEDGKIELTEAGHQHILRRMTLEPDGLREAQPFKVVVGPIASGAPVVQDPTIFDRLASSAAMRKIVGLEMESSAILALAYLRRLPCAIVMKGVMDHADELKNDNMKAFAAKASAECLVAFLRQQSGSFAPKRKDSVGALLDAGTSPLPTFSSPAALLNARHAIVPFVGRGQLVKSIVDWCEGRTGVSARLIHGPGGTGKTRLMIELCRQMRDRGWLAGFIPKRAGPELLAEVMEDDRPTLAVIDYAESRARLRALLAPALRRRNSGDRGRLRLVLLSRNPGDWWAAELQSEVADLLSDEKGTELLPLAAPGGERDGIFRAAAQRFAEQRNNSIALDRTPPLSDPIFDRVLYVHMAALAVVDGREFSAQTLMDQTLDHEERFWSQKFDPQRDLDERLLQLRIRRVVAALTLRGGAEDRTTTEELVERVGGTRDDALALLLRDLYPGEEAGYIAGLHPDLLGESMVHRALKAEGAGVGPLLDRMFEAAKPSAIRTGFEVLGRLSDGEPEVEAWIAWMLERDVSGRAVEALKAAKVVRERTAHSRLGVALAATLARHGTLEIARTMDAVGLPGQSVSLNEVALWVATTLLNELPDSSDPHTFSERARLLSDLGVAQGSVGLKEAAFASGRAAVLHYRRLAKHWPDEFSRILAVSLCDLGRHHAELGQFHDALDATLEGTELLRTTNVQDNDATDLADALTQLSARYGDLGERQQALACIEEAVQIGRSLASAFPEEAPTLANCLVGLGLAQSDLGQPASSLASADEAVTIFRALARERPDAFLSSLANSLSNLGKARTEAGDPQNALLATQEAVALRRKLAHDRPRVFLPDLAISLMNQGNQLGGVGQPEAATRSLLEATEIYRKLSGERPDFFRWHLARCLLNLGAAQARAEDYLAAAESTREALSINRELAVTYPDANLPLVAKALSNLASTQEATGELEGALESTSKGVRILRELARKLPRIFVPELARSLLTLASRQQRLGNRDAALITAQEGVQFLRDMHSENPDGPTHALASGLRALAAKQYAMGRPGDAIDCYREAISLYRTPGGGESDDRLAQLATTLSNLSALYVDTKRPADGHACAIESVRIFGSLPRVVRRTHVGAFAAALDRLSACQCDLRLPSRALTTAKRALVMGRVAVRSQNGGSVLVLFAILANLAERQMALRQYEEALVSREGALRTVWPLFLESPQTHAHTIAKALRRVLQSYSLLKYPRTSELAGYVKTFEAKIGHPAVPMEAVRLPNGSRVWVEIPEGKTSIGGETLDADDGGETRRRRRNASKRRRRQLRQR